MELPYLYIPYHTKEIQVYFLPSHHHDLLQNDANHTIVAVFLQNAQSSDFIWIQDKLVSLYGGSREEYPALRYSLSMYLIRLPEFLDRVTVLQGIQDWASANRIYTFSFISEDVWHPTPPPFRIHLRIHDFPIIFWHPYYINLMAAHFGLPLYVDEANLRGMDPTNLRLTVQCYDPENIPEIVALHYEGSWKTCQIIVRGWELNGGSSPDGFDGPTSGGNTGEVNWLEEHSQYRRGSDAGLRDEIATARETIFRSSRLSPTDDPSPSAQGWGQRRAMARTGTLGPPCTKSNGPKVEQEFSREV